MALSWWDGKILTNGEDDWFRDVARFKQKREKFEAVSISMRNFTRGLLGSCELNVLSIQPKVRNNFSREKKFNMSLWSKNVSRIPSVLVS